MRLQFTVRTLLLAITLAPFLSGCTKYVNDLTAPNQAPELSLEPVVTTAADRGTYRVRLGWSGTDADGRIEHYVYAVDPASVDKVDASWVTTKETRVELEIPVRVDLHGGPVREPHVFAIRAVDDQEAMSEVKTAPFAEGNVPPSVTITHPPPTSLLTPLLTPMVQITWQAKDPEPGASQVARYKFILLGPGSEFPVSEALIRPDSLRRYYAPGFAGWDSSGADSTSIHYSDLPPNEEYMFVVVAIDEEGDYSPVFSLSSSMLRFRVGFPGSTGPELHVYTEFIKHRFLHGSDPREIPVVRGRTSTIHWVGTPAAGADLIGYRWVVDPVDPKDYTPRTDPSDIHHWTEFNLDETSVTLGPFGKAGPHRLHIEAEDSFGWRTQAIVDFVQSEMNLKAPLLIVDDTRFLGDRWLVGTDCVRAPSGSWPTAAELDTFLYARGGVPWRCYPEGTLSPPGVFNGYSFDTVGTRGMTEMPLALLGQYQHVIWMVDQAAAQIVREPSDRVDPTTLMRQMSQPGHVNTLALYAANGGKVWVLGGGIALASLLPWNDRNNDSPTLTFSALGLRPELAPGRMMYDLAGWRSEMRASTDPALVRRFGGRLEGSPTTNGLPEAMELKTPASDPLPPLRTTSNFYRSTISLEYLQASNLVVENGESTLDTLYRASGGGLFPPSVVSHNVVMTRYQGPAVPQGFVFTGFDIWTFQRTQCVQLVDYVLGNLWGLQRQALATQPSTARVAEPAGGGRRRNP